MQTLTSKVSELEETVKALSVTVPVPAFQEGAAVHDTLLASSAAQPENVAAQTAGQDKVPGVSMEHVRHLLFIS